MECLGWVCIVLDLGSCLSVLCVGSVGLLRGFSGVA